MILDLLTLLDELIDNPVDDSLIVDDKPVLLLVDLSYISHRGIQSQGERTITLSNSVFNALRLIFNIVGRYGCTEAIICTDSHPYKRSEIHEDYKADRREREEDAVEHLVTVKQIVSTAMMQLSTPVIEIEGAEADDLIAHFVRTNLDKRVVILSSDSDLHALQDVHNDLIQAYPTIGKGGENTEINKSTLAIKYPEAKGQFWKLTLLHIIGGGHNFGYQIPNVGTIKAWRVIEQIPENITNARDALDWLYKSAVRFPGKTGLVKAYTTMLNVNYTLNQFPLVSLKLEEETFLKPALNLDNLDLMAVYLRGAAELVPASIASMLEKCNIPHDIDIK